MKRILITLFTLFAGLALFAQQLTSEQIQQILGLRDQDGRPVRLEGTGTGVDGTTTTFIGIPYNGETVNISVSSTREDKWYAIDAKVVKGPKVTFISRLPYENGDLVSIGKDYAAVWNRNGLAFRFNKCKTTVEKTGGGIRLDSKPTKHFGLKLLVSEADPDLKTGAEFFNYAAGKTISLDVMSYNIRVGAAKDKANSWEYRKPGSIALIKQLHPDIFGLQEALSFQVAYLEENFPEYKSVGVPRDNGIDVGEQMQIFYNAERFKLLKWENFWLNETPDQPAKGWDAACIRTATMVYLKDKKSGRKFFYVNTHLDHVGKEARKNGLSLIVDYIKSLNPDGNPLVLTGDFNVTPDDPCLKSLEGRMLSARDTAPVTDYHWTLNDWSQEKNNIIDYIYWSGFAGASRYHTCVEDYGVPYLSDHYPVISTLIF